MREHEAPFYLRRTKEALVTFPHPDTGEVHKLFTKREVRTAAFDLDGDELDFYDELTRYVEDQSMAAASDESARGRAVGFTMALLQRRMASSVYAVRRSLERMRDRREKILEDPEAHRQQQIERRVPEDFDDLTEEEQQRIIGQLEGEVLSADPAVLREEIGRLTRLIDQAKVLEGRDAQSKTDQAQGSADGTRLFHDPKMRLLVFTEHKDTLDYLAGDGRDHRPLGKLREWGLAETARGEKNVAVVVSIPASELEYTTDDIADESRFKKMLDRLGKAIMMSPTQRWPRSSAAGCSTGTARPRM